MDGFYLILGAAESQMATKKTSLVQSEVFLEKLDRSSMGI
jgi:hypothetical protein